MPSPVDQALAEKEVEDAKVEKQQLAARKRAGGGKARGKARKGGDGSDSDDDWAPSARAASKVLPSPVQRGMRMLHWSHYMINRPWHYSRFWMLSFVFSLVYSGRSREARPSPEGATQGSPQTSCGAGPRPGCLRSGELPELVMCLHCTTSSARPLTSQCT